jgi:P pilus assembly chaperone PapD
MNRTLKLATLALAVAASCAAPAAAAAAPVQITGFTVSPSCVKPGGNVTATVTVQNTTWYPQVFYAQSWVTDFGAEVQTGSVVGPYSVPVFAPLSQTQTQQVPWYTPWGYYNVWVGAGPSSSDGRSYSQRFAPLTVSPFC